MYSTDPIFLVFWPVP